MATPKKTIDFEDSLKRLDQLVANMEKGDLSLEDSLKAFEQGIEIVRHCEQALRTAEQRVAVLQTGREPAEDDTQ